MNIVVLGSNGMAGHIISKYLKSKGYFVIDVARKDTSITANFENKNDVDRMFDELSGIKIDYVINCVGLLVSESISRPDRAAILNSWLPHYLEYKLSHLEAKLIHLSTDCVFDGSEGNYIETSLHTERNNYGKSKSLGEVNNNKDVTFRMSIIGPEIKDHGTGLLHWFLNKSENEVTGWSNAQWNGITTLQLAKCIEKYIELPIISGIYHLVNNKVNINKYDLLVTINKIYGLTKTVKKGEGPKDINKILVDTRQIIDFEIPDYDTQLTELKNF